MQTQTTRMSQTKSTKKSETAKKPAEKKTVKDFAEKVAGTVKSALQPKPATTVKPSPPVVSVTKGAPFAEAEFAKKENNKEYVFDVAQPESMVPLLRDAWNAVRDKSDAPFDECAGSFKQILLQHAVDVIKTSAVLKGDTALARFEQQVAKIKAINSR